MTVLAVTLKIMINSTVILSLMTVLTVILIIMINNVLLYNHF